MNTCMLAKSTTTCTCHIPVACPRPPNSVVDRRGTPHTTQQGQLRSRRLTTLPCGLGGRKQCNKSGGGSDGAGREAPCRICFLPAALQQGDRLRKLLTELHRLHIRRHGADDVWGTHAVRCLARRLVGDTRTQVVATRCLAVQQVDGAPHIELVQRARRAAWLAGARPLLVLVGPAWARHLLVASR